MDCLRLRKRNAIVSETVSLRAIERTRLREFEAERGEGLREFKT